MLEKRNIVEEQRTPCKCKTGKFCDCAKAHVKEGAESKPESIQDVENLSRLHK